MNLFFLRSIRPVALVGAMIAGVPSIAAALSSALIPASPGPSNLSSGGTVPGEIFLKDESAAYFGWTFDYDDVNGRFVPKKWLFSVQLNDNTGSGQHHVSYKTVLSSGNTSFERRTSFDVAGGLAMVQFAAQMASSSAIHTSSLSTQFVLSAENEFPRAFVDPLTIPTTAFDQEALGILAIADPQTRADAWENANFGRYVALGYGLRGGCDVTFSFTQQDSFRRAEHFYSMSGQYKSVSASGEIATAMAEAMSSGTASIDILSDGCLPPLIPSLQDIDTLSEQFGWGSSLTAYSANCKRRQGVYLLPVAALPSGPSFGAFSWSDAAINDAALEAQFAIDTLVSSSRWNNPASLVSYLAGQFRPAPNANVSFSTALQTARSALANHLQALRVTALAYLAGTDTATNLAAKKNRVRSHALKLQTILDELRQRVNSLPPMTMQACEWWTPIPNTPNATFVNVQFRIRVTNAAAFWDGSASGLVAWAQYAEPTGTVGYDGPESIGTLNYYEDDQVNFIWNRYRPVSQVQITATPIYDGSAAHGLHDVLLEGQFVVRDASRFGTLKFVDDFQRQVVLPVDLEATTPCP